MIVQPDVEPRRGHASPATPLFLHQFFARAARRWPDRIAVDVPPGRGRPLRAQTTYAQLDRQSEAIAVWLRPHVSYESAVAILLPRDSADLYAAQLGALKSGAAHVCVDPSFPDDRIRGILEDVDAAAILTDPVGAARLTGRCLSPLFDVTGLPPMAPLVGSSLDATWLTPESLAYIIFTSGTMGRPKGVMIEHRSVVNLVAGDLEEFQLTPDDRVCQGSSASYDSSIEETWLAFAAGATLVVMDDETARSGPDVIGWLRRERISVFTPPPTLLRATGCGDPSSALPDLKLLYVGGEPLPIDLADRWCKGRRMVNGYGPTECTVTCLRDPVEHGRPVAIGHPIDGVRAVVLNDALDQVPQGEQGELCIGGIGLARGYWRQPEATAEKFVTLPMLGRFYRTGDRVHEDRDGRFFYHGRLDAQVKIRGYRIELEEIEAHLAACSGVRAAACRVQHDVAGDGLVAFIVPANASMPPSSDALRTTLSRSLPGYMVPSAIGVLAQLPTTAGGKLDRSALPRLAPSGDRTRIPPRNPLEAAIERAVAVTLGLKNGAGVHHDFFNDLGGDSLRAAQLVTRLRNDAATDRLTVRDIYEARTVARLAARASAHMPAAATPPAEDPVVASAGWRLVTMVQVAWLMAVLAASGISSWIAGMKVLPWLSGELGLLPLILLAPIIGLAASAIYAPLSVVFAVAVKRSLIGRYQPMRAPVWSAFYARHWLVRQAVRLVPWGMLGGTVYQQVALRALGARIGRRVHIHRGVNLLAGGWDLLHIEDEVTISQDAAVRLIDLDAGQIVVGPVRLARGATLETRAGVSAHTVVEAGATLTALSSLPAGGRIPRGERWDGVPARPAGQSAARPTTIDGRELPPWLHGLALLLARAGLALLVALPVEAVAIGAAVASGATGQSLAEWIAHPTLGWTLLLVTLVTVMLAVPLTLAWTALVSRAMGRVRPDTIGRWTLAYVRVWLKSGLVDEAGEWLSGTLFWPVWLRWAGMTVGTRCEISTISDVIPELIQLGDNSFFADGIYLGGPRIHQGAVTLARTRLGSDTFLGNHVVIAAGSTLPDDLLLGISTATSDAVAMPAGSAWFGHPPFELPRREVVEMDRRLTHDPSAVRYWNRVFWELLRFALPVGPLIVLMVWFRIAASHGLTLPGMMVVSAATFGAAASLCLFVVVLKWTLLGRVQPGRHALWSCWCSRWDFLYVAWGQYARPILEHLEGTLLLSWYLRGMGMTVGRRAVLGGGFAQVVDPDMIDIGDEATVSALFQAHTFEDRVLKIDRIRIGRGATVGSGAVLLYGADIGAGTHVAPHSVVMKGERLLPHVRYEGVPVEIKRNEPEIRDRTGDQGTNRRSGD